MAKNTKSAVAVMFQHKDVNTTVWGNSGAEQLAVGGESGCGTITVEYYRARPIGCMRRNCLGWVSCSLFLYTINPNLRKNYLPREIVAQNAISNQFFLGLG